MLVGALVARLQSCSAPLAPTSRAVLYGQRFIAIGIALLVGMCTSLFARDNESSRPVSTMTTTAVSTPPTGSNSPKANRLPTRPINPLRAELEARAREMAAEPPQPIPTPATTREAVSKRGPLPPLGTSEQTKVVQDEADTKAAEAPRGDAGTTTAIDPTEIDAQVVPMRQKIVESTEALKANTDLEDPVKAELLKRYQAALEWLRNAEEAEQKSTQYEQDIKQAADLILKAREELAQAPTEPTAIDSMPRALAELEAQLAHAQSQLSDAKSVWEHREEDLKRRGERKGELAKLLEETKQRMEESANGLTVAPPPGETQEAASARRAEIQSRWMALRAQLDLYQSEAKRLDVLSDWFPLQRDLARRTVTGLEKQVERLQQAVVQARRVESERQAAEARRQAEMADPALADLAQLNAKLAEKRQAIAANIAAITQESSDNDKALANLNTAFQRARDKVAKAGHSTTVGLMLRKQREELPSVDRCLERLEFVEREMPVVNLDRLDLEDQRAALGDFEAAVQSVFVALEGRSKLLGNEQLHQTIRELLSTKRDLLDRLINEHDIYLAGLSELEVSNRRLIEQTDEFRVFTDEHVLWIRSTEPFRRKTFYRVKDGLLSMMRPTQWMLLIKNSGIDTLREPWMALGVLGAVVVLATCHAQLRRRIRQLCEARGNSVGWRFSPSILAVLLTGIATATWPLLVWYLGWRMRTAETTSALGVALGPALQYGAMFSWTSAFLRSICRRHGVAETFFDWPPLGLSLGRRSLRWLTLLGVPMAFMVRFSQVYDQGEWADSVGRIAFIIAMFVLAAFTESTFGRAQNVFREAIARDPKGWLNQVRAASHITGITVPLALAGLAIVGYYYSAQQLAVRLQGTLGLGLVVLFVHAMASRWFIVQRRRLSMQQARERQQSGDTQDANASLHAHPHHGKSKDATDWSEIHERLRLLLRQAVTVSVLVGSWFIWNDVLPALKILDRVQLWVQTIEITEVIEDGHGETVHRTYPSVVPTTLRHGLVASVILLATFVLGRNLPALLQITVLNQLPLDRGGRHAISVLAHYLVCLSGVLIACKTLHFKWSSVQWLAAGITVGLGFGLQEIFANFVSGIILLFERPIRVGDIITLDDVTGSVTSIRIRTTTITDNDRKELIVPNKQLINGKLLNWTLSDTTNRIVITVGLSYDTDPRRARDVLLETIRAHENVLAEPEPSVTFDSFGESSLNFVIRVFLASLEVRLMTVHELHVAIFRRLQEEGMEVAFPHRDVTVRHMNVPGESSTFLPPALHERRSEAA